MSERPALFNPDCKREMIIAAAAEVEAFAKKQLPISFVPSCSQPKKRRKSSPRGHTPGDIAGRDTELGLLQSRPDRPAGHRCAIADRMGFDRTFEFGRTRQVHGSSVLLLVRKSPCHSTVA